MDNITNVINSNPGITMCINRHIYGFLIGGTVACALLIYLLVLGGLYKFAQQNEPFAEGQVRNQINLLDVANNNYLPYQGDPMEDEV